LVDAHLDHPNQLAAAMAGCDVVVHAAALYPKTSRHPQRDQALALQQTQNVLDAAASAGVERLVYVSSTATVAPRADGQPSREADAWKQPPATTYHQIKWAMERQVASESRYKVAIALPAACLGPHDLRLGTTGLLVAAAHGRCPAHPDGWVGLVDVGDVANGLLALATLPDPPKRVILCGSSQRLHGLLVGLCEHYGTAPPSDPISMSSAREHADAAEIAWEGGGPRPALPREFVDLVAHGSRIDAAFSTHTLGLHYRPLSDTLDRFDTWARARRILPRIGTLEHTR
jgi:dihydroflavonol-4-reductase